MTSNNKQKLTESVINYETLDHTADLAVKVQAEFLPELYHNCASAMFDIMIGLENICPEKVGERFELSGTDLENLLVNMLSELLYRFNVHKMVYGDFTIEYLTHEKLTVYAKGQKFDKSIHELKTEIKAATYHDLQIEATADGFTVTIVFDV